MAIREIPVPSIGDFKNIPVIEILVKPGDVVAKDAPLVTLESDKATVEVPSPFPGTVKEIKVKLGDRVSKGSVIVTLDAAEGAESKPTSAKPSAPSSSPSSSPRPAAASPAPPPENAPAAATPKPGNGHAPSASPAVAPGTGAA